MVELIGEDVIFLADQGRDGAEIGGETRLEGDGRFHALEFSDALFEFKVQVQRAGDGANCTRPDAVLVHSVFGCLDQL